MITRQFIMYVLVGGWLLAMWSAPSARAQDKIGPVLGESPIIYTEPYIRDLMRKVCDWQLDNLNTTTKINKQHEEDVPSTGWIRGTFYTGVMATYYTTGDRKYLDNALQWGAGNDWQPGERPRHADFHCVGQTYAELYFIKKDRRMIEPIMARFDAMMDQPTRGPDVGWSKDKNWSWCDALFMAPPVLVRLYEATGQAKYLDLMNTHWWDTHRHLYDGQAHLYYRDAKFKLKPDGDGRRTPSGRKVFWGRGNGWVMAGLTRVLQYLPADYPDYPRYVELYKEMAHRIAELQQRDGLWRSSLNDPRWRPNPETSSSGFFCYALAWGVNNGLLDRERFMPVVLKAWEGLVWAVDDDGRLGWVQAVGHDPREVLESDTMEYGVAAFLLAGSEIIKLAN